jgi:hypothetical protein
MVIGIRGEWVIDFRRIPTEPYYPHRVFYDQTSFLLCALATKPRTGSKAKAILPDNINIRQTKFNSLTVLDLLM